MYAAHNFVCRCEVLLVAREEDDDFGYLLYAATHSTDFAGQPSPIRPTRRKYVDASQHRSLDSEF